MKEDSRHKPNYGLVGKNYLVSAAGFLKDNFSFKRLNFLAGDRQKICVDVLLEMLGMYFAVHPYRWKQHPPYFQIGYQRGTEQFAILQL